MCEEIKAIGISKDESVKCEQAILSPRRISSIDFFAHHQENLDINLHAKVIPFGLSFPSSRHFFRYNYNVVKSAISTEDSEAIKFLERDFNQCFMQIRHYDSQIWNISRFAFTAYIAILGTAIGTYRYSADKSIDLTLVAISVLGVGLVLGLLIYGLVIRNRVYYVFVCRYINEHRKLFLRSKPLGFKNITGMYVDPSLPLYFDWQSWQLCLCYIIAGLNALLASLLVFFALDQCPWQWILTLTLGIITALLQIWLGVTYLKSCETRKGSEAVFGKK